MYPSGSDTLNGPICRKSQPLTPRRSATLFARRSTRLRAARLVANVMPLKLTAVEEEAAFLRAVLDAIDSMVNFQILSLHGQDPESLGIGSSLLLMWRSSSV